MECGCDPVLGMTNFGSALGTGMGEVTGGMGEASGSDMAVKGKRWAGGDTFHSLLHPATGFSAGLPSPAIRLKWGCYAV